MKCQLHLEEGDAFPPKLKIDNNIIEDSLAGLASYIKITDLPRLESYENDDMIEEEGKIGVIDFSPKRKINPQRESLLLYEDSVNELRNGCLLGYQNFQNQLLLQIRPTFDTLKILKLSGRSLSKKMQTKSPERCKTKRIRINLFKNKHSFSYNSSSNKRLSANNQTVPTIANFSPNQKPKFLNLSLRSTPVKEDNKEDKKKQMKKVSASKEGIRRIQIKLNMGEIKNHKIKQQRSKPKGIHLYSRSKQKENRLKLKKPRFSPTKNSRNTKILLQRKR